MSDDHEHITRCTVHIKRWWGIQKLVIIATGSSHKEGELLIFAKDGMMYSINYANVLMMTAEPLP